MRRNGAVEKKAGGEVERTKSVGMGTEGADILLLDTLKGRVKVVAVGREARRGREEERERSADCIEGGQVQGAKVETGRFQAMATAA